MEEDANMMGTGLRLDGYVRVSRVGAREGEGFISPDVQSDALAQWAGTRGHHLRLHEPELNVSGGTMDRPVFNAIMERIRTGESDGIVVYRVDRFARSLLGALTTLAEIEQAGGAFASVSDDLDLTTPQGRAFLQIQLVIAELFRANIAEGFKVATQRAVARGVHISNVVPRGYDRIDGHLVPNDEAPAIEELFQRRAAGEGASSLARWLDTTLPRPNGEHWTPAHVRRLLTMRVYRGEAYHGAYRNPDAHKALVSEADFQRAALVRAPSPPRSDKATLLAGLVRCAGCRYLMTPSKSGAKGETLTYRCREKHTAGRCPAPATIVRSRLDRYVEEQALGKIAGRGAVGSAPLHVEEITARRMALEEDLDAFASDATARALLGEARYHAALESRVAALKAAQHEEQQALGSTSVGGDITVEDWSDWDTDERRLVLTQMIDAVFVEKMHGKPPVEARTFIAWRGELHDDLPRRGRVNGPVRPFVRPDRDETNPGMATA